MRPSMTIGDFSRATHLSAKALRLYHQSGLLTPAAVDAHNGYRRYAPEQLADARVIRELRALGLPVDVIRDVLAAPAVATRAELVSEHLERMEARLEEARAVRSLRGLLDETSAPIPITHRSVPETLAVAITETIALADLGTWFQRSVAELTALADGGALRRSGPYGGE
ncbi:MerR family transcriptional regulator [Cellulomonas chengniuliangii]|uniref:Helix-turn-helix domain-containing protein n=2 Tax=Cellulomonas chengniuliangii TaxID=2968084 RepID=A0ABY5L0U9_9CELL|nr:helix-turn-helix domain-containing protein [Cellulomonas chengniuliangii]MCC2309941.1 helix-turn-helix domain-containing protein [Cellulomonas chengniuliangii]UUI76381.1 helix-turn-helix domain-containing protein [Cellulomonas chengniuliangii]